MPEALSLIEKWWSADEIVRVYPDDIATRQFFEWVRRHSLGRKRLLDTLLASTYKQAGILSIATLNPADFAVFGCFQCITPTS